MNFEKLNYIIWAPNYRGNSAGIRSLYILAHELNNRGFKAYVTRSATNDKSLNAPLISLAEASCLAKLDNFIIIYPEVVSGNPLFANKVVRWVLNKPGFLGGWSTYNPSELIFYYSEAFRSAILNKISGKLYIPTLDEDLFYLNKEHSQKSITCFYVGKSIFQHGYFDPTTSFEITRDFPSRKTLGPLLRASKILYCFDNSTALIYEAIACGCPVVVIPDGTQSKLDYDQLELGSFGIAWGPTELERAKETVHLFPARYSQVKQDSSHQIDQFISTTQHYKYERYFSRYGAQKSELNTLLKSMTNIYQSYLIDIGIRLSKCFPWHLKAWMQNHKNDKGDIL